MHIHCKSFSLVTTFSLIYHLLNLNSETKKNISISTVFFKAFLSTNLTLYFPSFSCSAKLMIWCFDNPGYCMTSGSPFVSLKTPHRWLWGSQVRFLSTQTSQGLSLRSCLDIFNCELMSWRGSHWVEEASKAMQWARWGE